MIHDSLQPRLEYISVVETAKLIRQALANQFPGTKFSVQSSKYSGGAHINVRYSGGPLVDDVRSALAAFEGSGFDGSIDLKYSCHSWLAPDGSVSLAHNQGTAGSKGSVSESFGDPHAPGCRLVSFGADSIFVEREVTCEEYWPAVEAFEKATGWSVRHEIHRWNGREELIRCWPIEGIVRSGREPSEALRNMNDRGRIHDPALAPEMDPIEADARRQFGGAR